MKEPLFQGADSPYLNILIVAKKNSGKTNLIYNIIKMLCTPFTFLNVFQPTADMDLTQKAAMKFLVENNIISEDRVTIKDGLPAKEVKNFMKMMQSVVQHNKR